MEGNTPKTPAAAAPVAPTVAEANSNDAMAREQKKQNQILTIAMSILAVIVVALISGIIFFDNISSLFSPKTSPKVANGPVTYPNPVVTILPTIDPYASCGRSTSLEQALQNAKVACVLDLSNQDLTIVPDKIRNLTAMKKVVLDNNNFSVFPEPITLMRNLEEVSIVNNKLTDLPDLSKMKNLKIIDISKNQISENQQATIKAKIPSSVTIKF